MSFEQRGLQDGARAGRAHPGRRPVGGRSGRGDAAPDRGGRRAGRARSSRSTASARWPRRPASPAATRGPFAGVPVAVKANVPVAGLCMNYASRLLAGNRPSHSAYLVRRLREAGFVVVGIDQHVGVRDPPDHRAALHRADAQPVEPRPHARRLLRRVGGGRRGRARARRARQRRRRLASASPPPAAASSGSSRAAGASRAAPTAATPSSSARACSPARCRRRRSCSTSSAATRRATRRGRRAPSSRTRPPSAAIPAACGSPSRWTARSHRRRPSRERAGGARGGGHPAPSSATRWSRRRRPFPAPDSLEVFLQVFGPERGAGGRCSGELIAGRAAGDDDIEPLSRARRRLRARPALHGLPGARSTSCRRVARGTVAFFADHDVLLTPVLADAPAADRRAARLRRGAAGRPARSGEFAPVHRAVQRDGAAGHLRPARLRRGPACRAPSSSSGGRWPRTRSSRSPAQLELARPWAQHVPPLAA